MRILQSNDRSQFDKYDTFHNNRNNLCDGNENIMISTLNTDNSLTLFFVNTTARYSGCWQPLCRDPGGGRNIRQVGSQQDGNRGERPSVCHDSLGLQGIWPSSSYRLLYILFQEFGIFMSTENITDTIL